MVVLVSGFQTICVQAIVLRITPSFLMTILCLIVSFILKFVVFKLCYHVPCRVVGVSGVKVTMGFHSGEYLTVCDRAHSIEWR